MGGQYKGEGTYGYLWLIHVDIWQNPSQYCNYPPIKKKIFFLRNRAGGCMLPQSRGEVPQRGESYSEEAVVDVPGVYSALSSWVPAKGGEKTEFKMPVLQ